MPDSQRKVNHWAKVPRKVVLHRMKTAKCLESQLFWGMILWSWCGPEISDAVVLKDKKGFIRRDAQEKPIYATLKDLRELLELAPGMAGHVTRAAHRLEATHSTRLGEKLRGGGAVIYPEQEPALQETDSKIANTGNLKPPKTSWNIAGVIADIGNLPTDQFAKTEAIRWLEDLSTRWNKTLTEVRTEYREEARQGFSARGILIGKKQKSKEAKTPPTNELSQATRSNGSYGEDAAGSFVAAADSRTSLKGRIKKWLTGRFKIPTAPSDDVLAELAKILRDDEGLEQFKQAVPVDAKPEGWRYFLKIAQACADHRPAYEAAQPAEKLDKAQRFAREYEEEQRQKKEAKGAGA
jgi:hypothetical protein